MRRLAWLAFAPMLALIANACSAEDDAAPDAAEPTGGTTAAGAPSTAGGGAQTGGAQTGGVQTGGVQTGGVQSAGNPSGGGAAGGLPGAGGPNIGGNPLGGGAGGTVSTPGGSGGSVGRGGRVGFGGRSGSGGSGNASTGGTAEPAECSLVRDGATGDEPNGEIPVCCAPSTAEATEIQEVFELLNAHRMDNGVGALAYDAELEAAVQGHCLHMSQHSFFAHEAEESGVILPWDRAKLCGASANGENIAQGQRSPADVMDAWTESQGHNENMLNSRFTRVGIGYVASGRYWGQLFGQ